METETKYILCGVIFVVWITVRIFMMRRRSRRIQELRAQAREQEESDEYADVHEAEPPK